MKNFCTIWQFVVVLAVCLKGKTRVTQGHVTDSRKENSKAASSGTNARRQIIFTSLMSSCHVHKINPCDLCVAAQVTLAGELSEAVRQPAGVRSTTFQVIATFLILRFLNASIVRMLAHCRLCLQQTVQTQTQLFFLDKSII